LEVEKMVIPDFLSQDKLGEIRLTGHRIGLFHLVRHYNDGFSPEMLVCQYPSLPLAVVHKVIAFYLENLEEVDAYVKSCGESLDQQMGSSRRVDTVDLRRRLEAMQRARGA